MDAKRQHPSDVSICSSTLPGPGDVRACVRVCARACVHVCARACVRVCACARVFVVVQPAAAAARLKGRDGDASRLVHGGKAAAASAHTKKNVSKVRAKAENKPHAAQ